MTEINLGNYFNNCTLHDSTRDRKEFKGYLIPSTSLYYQLQITEVYSGCNPPTRSPICQWVDRPAKTIHLSVFERWNNCAEHITVYSVDAFPHKTHYTSLMASTFCPTKPFKRVLRDQTTCTNNPLYNSGNLNHSKLNKTFALKINFCLLRKNPARFEM